MTQSVAEVNRGTLSLGSLKTNTSNPYQFDYSPDKFLYANRSTKEPIETFNQDVRVVIHLPSG
jgi:hypothetical protein